MKKLLGTMTAIAFLGAMIACSSAPARVPEAPPKSETSKASTPVGPEPKPAAVEDAKSSLPRMKEYWQKYKDMTDQGYLVEGIRQLIDILAERRKLQDPPKDILEIARDAETELTKIGSAIALDCGTEWLDGNGNQVNASTIDVGSGKALQPIVIVTYNMGRGRSLVAGMPVTFEFTKGSGVLTGFVNTNENGQAICSVPKLDAVNQEHIIRASIAITSSGFTRRFQGVEKDFVYVPPTRRATILVLERSSLGPSQPPIILDPVFNRLKGVAFDFSQYDGVLLGDSFTKVFGGDPQAIQALGVKKDVSYLVSVLNDCTLVSQVVIDGKKYNLFKSSVTATTRVIRVIDGKILYSGVVPGVAGQGGTEEKAVADGFKKAAEEMAKKLDMDLVEISKVLTDRSK
jgi:hypothetical protein